MSGSAVIATVLALLSDRSSTCDSVQAGYTCQSEISQYWGQYSPYFAVPSDLSTDVPSECTITFAQLLSRHGARFPTSSKSKSYNATIAKIHSQVKDYAEPYSFLSNYTYKLGSDDLTSFGQQQMVNSGILWYQRYHNLSRSATPYVRAAGEQRVVESAFNWTQGFHQAKLDDTSTDDGDTAYPYPVLVISEAAGKNNSLNHGTCAAFENGTDGKLGGAAQDEWKQMFIPAIQDRLNKGLPGVNLTVDEVINMIDLCPFNTVADPNGDVSDFCSLFDQSEFMDYDYYQTLGKYYGYGVGNPLGPTQGVGFVNELIARLTNKPVIDDTSTNHTLDSDNTTFPLGRQLYADFSHDNTMTSILAALGLYNTSTELPTNSSVVAEDADGYSAAWTVPFAARITVEKLQCDCEDEEQVRIIVNDRVVPLPQCEGDDSGLCPLSKFIDSLSFAAAGGRWGDCNK